MMPFIPFLKLNNYMPIFLATCLPLCSSINKTSERFSSAKMIASLSPASNPVKSRNMVSVWYLKQQSYSRTS